MDARDDLVLDALQQDSRRPQPDEMRSIFAGLDLEGNFWDPQSDPLAQPIRE
jgi:hypothetical protein